METCMFLCFHVQNLHKNAHFHVSCAFCAPPYIINGKGSMVKGLLSRGRCVPLATVQNNLHKLKLRLAKQWKLVTEKADEDVR